MADQNRKEEEATKWQAASAVDVGDRMWVPWEMRRTRTQDRNVRTTARNGPAPRNTDRTR